MRGAKIADTKKTYVFNDAIVLFACSSTSMLVYCFYLSLSGMWVSSGLKKYCITKYKMVTKIARERERERERES